MRFAVIVFPGTWSDGDCYYVLNDILGQPTDYVWHREADLSPYDCIILPGGFSYGDYLRAGAIARFSPVMEAVVRQARAGKLVLGICNGFQILCEAGLLPGALIRNESLQYRCQWVNLRVENTDTPFTIACRQGQVLGIPIPSDFAVMMPYVLTILALVVTVARVRSPSALTKPFERGG